MNKKTRKTVRNTKTSKDAMAAKRFVRKHLKGFKAGTIVRGPTMSGRNEDPWIDDETSGIISDPVILEQINTSEKENEASVFGRRLKAKELKALKALSDYLFGDEENRAVQRRIESFMAESAGFKSVKIGH